MSFGRERYDFAADPFIIGDGMAGDVTLIFHAATDGHIVWDETSFDFGSANIVTTGSGRFDGWIGIGVTPSYPIHLKSAATDSAMLYLDHGTNDIDVANTTTSYGIWMDYDIGGSGTATSYTYKGMYVDMDWTGTDTSSALSTAESLYACDLKVTSARTISTTPQFYSGQRLYAFNLRSDFNNTYTNCADFTYNVKNYAGRYYAYYAATLNDAGSTITGENIGLKIDAYAAGALETAGTHNLDNYGLFVDVDAKTFTNGTVTNYGIYLDVDVDADANYGLYIKDNTALGNTSYAIYNLLSANSLIGVDNAKTLYGTGEDASVYFDGSDFIINSENVTANDEVHFTNFDLYTFDNPVKANGYQSSDGSAGLSATYTFGGGGSGDIASMTFKNGLLTAVTTVP